jgi:hypothetical protein
LGGEHLDNPIFRLEGIVKTRAEEMEDFVGPLDLILHLEQEQDRDTDIRIFQLLDQYMAYLEEPQCGWTSTLPASLSHGGASHVHKDAHGS